MSGTADALAPAPGADLLTEALQQSSDCHVLFDLEARVCGANLAASRWLEVPLERLIGTTIADHAADSAVIARNLGLLSTLAQFLQALNEQGHGFAEDEMSLFAADSSLLVASTRILPVTVAGHPPRLLWSLRFLDQRRVIFRASTVAMARLDASGRLMQANSAFQNLVMESESGLADRAIDTLVAEADRPAWAAALASLPSGGGGQCVSEQRLTRAEGSAVWTRCTVTHVPGVTRFDGFLLSVWEDVSERRAAQLALHRREQSQRVLAELGALAVTADDETEFLAAAVAALRQVLEQRVGPGTEVSVDIRPDALGSVRGRNGLLLPVPREGALEPFQVCPEHAVEDDLVTAAGDLVRSAVARIRAEHAITYQMLHDSLTGLANRRLLHERLAEALRPDVAVPRSVGVVFVDLDGFKPVNDALGHAAGDDVLREFSARLQQLSTPGDLLVRLGGDEFVLVRELGAGEQVGALMDLVARAAERPFPAAGRLVLLSASVGGVTGSTGDTVEDLLKAADDLMYAEKQLRHEAGSAGRSGELRLVPEG